MRLAELEPRWVGLDGVDGHVGLTFLCPHCRQERLAVAIHHRGHEAFDDAAIRAHLPGGDGFAAHIWTVEGADDFAALTLTPSVDASRVGHWHGWITNGEIR